MSYSLDVNLLLYASDGHLAALLRFHGVRTLYTSDRDFLRFDFLDIQDPLV